MKREKNTKLNLWSIRPVNSWSEDSRATVRLSLVEYGFWRNANRDIIGLRSYYSIRNRNNQPADVGPPAQSLQYIDAQFLRPYEISHDFSGKVGMHSPRREFQQVNQQPIVPARNRDRLLAQFSDRQIDYRLNPHGG